MPQEHTLTFGPFRLESISGRLLCQDDVIALRPRSLAMLKYLAERPGRLVTKAELLQQVWAGAHVSDDVLRASVRDIRRALGDAAEAPQYLETVGRQGYRFLQRGDALLLQTAGPVVGRQREVEQLQSHFGQAVGGERQVVLLSGEPGIGKTTVVKLFLERMGTRDSVRVAQGQCSVHYGDGEAYQPLLQALGQLGKEPGGPGVLAVLQRYAPMWLVQLPALVNGAELERLQHQVQGATRARMVREFCEAIEVLTADIPLVLILEDLHWSDVSTVELLAAIAQRPTPTRLFVLGTYRPADAAIHAQALRSVVQELRGRGQCDELALELLSPADVAAYVAGRLGGAVPEHVSRLITRCTEGNPLFMVNLLDHLAQQGTLLQQDGRWTVAESATEIATMVPEGLRPLIVRRLETLLPEERRVLEVASVAGPDSATVMVAAGLQCSVEEVEGLCESLATRGHFIAACGLSLWPDGTLSGRYRFQHALYHQVLYEQIGAARRAQMHRRLGECLEAGYGERAGEVAAELAVHFEQGHDVPRAATYRQLVGEQALSRHAYREAIQHLRRALEWLQSLPETQERLRQELTLHLALGTALAVTKGWPAAEVGASYHRAQVLCQQLGETPHLFAVLWGLWHFHAVRAEPRAAQEFGERLLGLAQHTQDSAYALGAHFMLGGALTSLGEFAAARGHWEQTCVLYDVQQHHHLVNLFGADPGVFSLSFMSHTLWFLGHPEQALNTSHAALALAQRLECPFSLALAYAYSAMLHHFRREPWAVQPQAEAAIALCAEQGFAYYLAWGKIMHAWAQGASPDAILQMQQGLTALRATGGRARLTYYLALVAAAYGDNGQATEGLHLLSEAKAEAGQTEECFWQAELDRLHGELLVQAGTDSKTVEERFVCALATARQQHAKALELRAASSLSRLWQQQGKSQQAYELLAPVYNWFTEGWDTADLREAKALLDESMGSDSIAL